MPNAQRRALKSKKNKLQKKNREIVGAIPCGCPLSEIQNELQKRGRGEKNQFRGVGIGDGVIDAGMPWITGGEVKVGIAGRVISGGALILNAGSPPFD